MGNDIAHVEDMSKGEIAKAFIESGFFTDTRNMSQAIVKIQAGEELGLGRFASMDGIDIIQGKTRMNANALASLIKSSGKYNFKVVKHDSSECIIDFYERWDGGKLEKIGTSEFTMEEAQQAGLTFKDNWKKHPKNMLFARCLSNGARWHTPDVCKFKIYTEADELGTDVDVDNSGIDKIKEELKAKEEEPEIEVINAEFVETKVDEKKTTKKKPTAKKKEPIAKEVQESSGVGSDTATGSEPDTEADSASPEQTMADTGEQADDSLFDTYKDLLESAPDLETLTGFGTDIGKNKEFTAQEKKDLRTIFTERKKALI